MRRSFDSASDCAVRGRDRARACAGDSARACRRRMTTHSDRSVPNSRCTSRNALALFTALSILRRLRTIAGLVDEPRDRLRRRIARRARDRIRRRPRDSRRACSVSSTTKVPPARPRESGTRRRRGRRARARPTRRRGRPCTARCRSPRGSGGGRGIEGDRRGLAELSMGRRVATGAFRRTIAVEACAGASRVAESARDSLARARHAVSAARHRACRAQRIARGERRSHAAAPARCLPAGHLPVVQRRSAGALVEPGSADGAVRRRVPHRALTAQATQAAIRSRFASIPRFAR